jgi:hypothetical protein
MPTNTNAGPHLLFRGRNAAGLARLIGQLVTRHDKPQRCHKPQRCRSSTEIHHPSGSAEPWNHPRNPLFFCKARRGHVRGWELINMASPSGKHYSLLTGVLLVSAFALLGYMAAQLSDRISSKHGVATTLAAINAARDTNAAAPPRLAAITPNPATPAAPADDQPSQALAPPKAKEDKEFVNSPGQDAAIPPVVLLNPGSTEQSAKEKPGNAAAPGEQADVPRPDDRNSRKSEQAAAPPQTPVDEAQTENRRSKVMRRHRSRYREVAEQDGPPRRPQRDDKVSRAYMPAQGGHLFPFLPFLPF